MRTRLDAEVRRYLAAAIAEAQLHMARVEDIEARVIQVLPVDGEAVDDVTDAVIGGLFTADQLLARLEARGLMSSPTLH